MNYLAHLYLSDRTPDGFAGSLLGDFVTGEVRGKFGKNVENEILMHRRIDAFTDSHAIVKRSKSRISAEIRKYAGVLIDVFYDHYLADNFDKYSVVPLKTFSRYAYRALVERRNLFPENFRQRIDAIARYDLLGSYAGIDGIRIALERISMRIKRENRLAAGVFDLQNNYRELHADFEEFFPQLVAFVETARKD